MSQNKYNNINAIYFKNQNTQIISYSKTYTKNGLKIWYNNTPSHMKKLQKWKNKSVISIQHKFQLIVRMDKA